jgi:hypothetical protein
VNSPFKKGCISVSVSAGIAEISVLAEISAEISADISAEITFGRSLINDEMSFGYISSTYTKLFSAFVDRDKTCKPVKGFLSRIIRVSSI